MIKRILKIAALFVVFVIVAGLSSYFFLSLMIQSEDTVVVPGLIGKNVVYVLELLTELGLNTKVKGSEYNAEIPQNHVIFQDPEPGAEIKKGRDVKIILSKGTLSVPVPNLKGLSAEQSRIIIEENDLCRGIVSSTYSDSAKKDEVIAQTPSPGVLLSRGQCINLLVSMGSRPQAYMMPDLIGLTLDDAIPLIERSHLLLTHTTSDYQTEKPLNTIVSQEPLSGYRVLSGNAVGVVVNRKTNPKNPALLDGAGGVSLFKYRVKNGFLKKQVRIRLILYGIANDVVNKLMKPGEEIWVLIPQNAQATVFLYEDDQLIKTELFGQG